MTINKILANSDLINNLNPEINSQLWKPLIKLEKARKTGFSGGSEQTRCYININYGQIKSHGTKTGGTKQANQSSNSNTTCH